MEYVATDDYNPKYNIWEKFITDSLIRRVRAEAQLSLIKSDTAITIKNSK